MNSFFTKICEIEMLLCCFCCCRCRASLKATVHTMSAPTWYVLPTTCLPGGNSSISKSQQQTLPQQASLCPYPSIDNIRSSSASFLDVALLPGQLSHADWAVPFPLGGSASSNITSGGSFAAGNFAMSDAGAAYVGMFDVDNPSHAAAAAPAAAAAASAAAAPAAPRDTIADVLALLGSGSAHATASSAGCFADDIEPVVPRRTAKAGVCPPPPVRPLPAVMLVPAAEVMQHISCTAV
jgi:hypothetical protein